MQINLQNLLKNNSEIVSIDFSNILHIQKLGGMSNENYLVITQEKSYFVRIEKNVQSDINFGGKFDFEYKIYQMLEYTKLVPIVYYNGTLDTTKLMIQEVILESQNEDKRDEYTANSICQIHDFDIKPINFIDTLDSVSWFLEKYNQRIGSNSILKQLNRQVIGFANVYKASISQKNVLVHADFRVDNTILTQNRCCVIDWESAIIGDESLGVVGYYMGSLFFERFDGGNLFNPDVYEAWINRFSHISKGKLYFFSILQYFSDLSWLENYLIVNNDDILQKLFEKNIKQFDIIYEYIIEQIKKEA